jgi:serine/threonine protein kinase
MAKEAILWAHLYHPNILPFYGVYTQNISERICIISPWMSRGDLSAYLKNCPDTPRLSLVRVQISPAVMLLKINRSWTLSLDYAIYTHRT